MEKDIFLDIFKIIKDRIANPKEGSYVCYLLDKGLDKTLKKIGEEATEVVIAAKNTKEELVYEMADLWFHSLVLLAQAGLSPDEVYKELRRRHKQ